MKLKEFIEPTLLSNCDMYGDNLGDKKFDTNDYVYLYDDNAIFRQDINEKFCYPTDYALLQGAVCSHKPYGYINERVTYSLLRSHHTMFTVNSIDYLGKVGVVVLHYNHIVLRPVLNLNCKKVINTKRADFTKFQIGKQLDANGKEVFKTITFGDFPQTIVDENLTKRLEELYKKNCLKNTGKKYVGCYNEKINDVIYNDEFEYENERYVRTKIVTRYLDNLGELSTGKSLSTFKNEYVWVKVEPLVWRICNWKDLPKSINQYGTGRADKIELQSLKGIMAGLFFYPSQEYAKNSSVYNSSKNEWSETTGSMWQNSMIRAYFNGYDIHKQLEQKNGDAFSIAPQNYNFENKGFIDEAFNQEIEISFDEKDEVVNQNQKSKAEIMRDELIKKALEKQKQKQKSKDTNQDENTLQ